jgi:hypothetical protein
LVGIPKYKNKIIGVIGLLLIFTLVSQTNYSSISNTNTTSKYRLLKPNANVNHLILSSLPLDLSNTAIAYFIPGGEGEILLTFNRFGSNPEDYELILYSTNWTTPLKSDTFSDDNKIEVSHLINTDDIEQAFNSLWKVEIKRTGTTSDASESWSLDMTYPAPWLDFQSQNVNKTNSKIFDVNISSPGSINIVLRDYGSSLTENINSQVCSPCVNLNMYLFPPSEEATGNSYDGSASSVANPERIRSFRINSNDIGIWHLRVDVIVGDAANFVLELGFIPDEESTTTTQPPISNGNPTLLETKTSCLGAKITTQQLVFDCTADEWTVISVLGGIIIGVLGFVWKFVFRRKKS